MLRSISLALVWLLLGLFSVSHFSQSANSRATSIELRVFVQGDTSRLPNFVESMRREFGEQGMRVELVERGIEFDYNIVLAQESSMGGAAAAVVVLDKGCNFVASVVRSGRLSGKGALNASAKELAKKIALLRGVK